MAIRNGDDTGFGVRLLRGARAIVMAWERRRTVGRLGALDDRMLADIGISRQDVLSALAEPLFADPSETLARRARETRRARHAAARLAQQHEAELAAQETPRRAA